MGNFPAGKLIEMRNLFAENDLYQLFEFTSPPASLYYQRSNYISANLSQFMTFFVGSEPATCTRETLCQFTRALIHQISLNSEIGVQVCAHLA